MKVTANRDIRADDDAALQEALKRRGEIPSHIAMIMDGNGRWAREQGKRRVAGHRAGVDSVREITEACARLGVDYLTLYTFSHENWDRPSAEVRALMRLLLSTIRHETRTLDKNNIRLLAVGDLSMMPEEVRRGLHEAMEETRNNDRMTLTIAVSYSGRLEIVRAAQKMAERVRAGVLQPEDIDEELFETVLMTSHMPDPDLLIRTGRRIPDIEFSVMAVGLYGVVHHRLLLAGLSSTCPVRGYPGLPGPGTAFRADTNGRINSL